MITDSNLINQKDKDRVAEIICEDLKFRILNPMEVENLTEDALSYLLFLKDSCTISEESFEAVLVDISSIFGVLDLESLKNLLDYRGIGVAKIIN